MKTSDVLLLAAGLALGYMVLGRKTDLQLLPVTGGGAGGLTILETAGGIIPSMPSLQLGMPAISFPSILPAFTMPAITMPAITFPKLFPDVLGDVAESMIPDVSDIIEGATELMPGPGNIIEKITGLLPGTETAKAPREPSGEPYRSILDWTMFNPMKGLLTGMQKAGTGFGQFVAEFFGPEQVAMREAAQAKFEKAGLEEVRTPEDLMRFQEAQDGTETPTIYDEKTGEVDITYKPKVTPETFRLPTW